MIVLDNALGELWHPIWSAWWAIFGVPMTWALKSLVGLLSGNGLAEIIGPFGLAVIFLTVGIKLVLSPIFQYQLVTSRRVQAEQRKIAPQLAALRKKYRKDPQKLNQEMMALYRQHNINPLAQMSGCLPALIQTPILIALYWAIFGAQHTIGISDFHFLWMTHLDTRPMASANFLLQPGALVLPILSGLTTYISSKMLMPAGGMPGQDQSQAAVTQSMTTIMPLMVAFFALQFPAALALYWTVSNLFAIGQQYFVTGWGSLSLPSRIR